MKAVIGVLVTLLVLVIGFGAAIKFDVAGLGTKIIGPKLVDVPVVNMILPEMPAEEGEEGAVDGYNFETIEESVEILKITEKMLKESGDEAEILSEQITQLTAEVARLKIFEANQLQFEKDKDEFDQLIVDESAAIEFKEWYESISPENAADIYAQVVEKVAYDDEQKMVISIYQNMKPSDAAAALEVIVVTKLDQVSDIIKGITPSQAAEILGQMTPENAAKITSNIYPVQ